MDDKLGLIERGDLHLVVSRATEVCTVWRKGDQGGIELFRLDMRNRTAAQGEGHWGHLPPGTYLLGAPSDCHTIPLGLHYTPILDLDVEGPLHQHGRIAIGIHGGGTGLHDPFAGEQGWVKTHGCERVQNGDNARLVAAIRPTQAKGARAYFTVVLGREGGGQG